MDYDISASFLCCGVYDQRAHARLPSVEVRSLHQQ